MSKEKRKKATLKRVVFTIVGTTILTTAGLIAIPPIVEKYANKKYKSALQDEAIDFDDMGPEIVSFPDETSDEDGE